MSGESATSARVLLAAASISGMKTGILFEFKSNIERSFRIPMRIVFSNRQEKDYNYHYKMNKTLNPYQRLTNRPSRSIKGWFWSIRVGLLSSFSSIKAKGWLRTRKVDFTRTNPRSRPRDADPCSCSPGIDENWTMCKPLATYGLWASYLVAL